jgi:hypothetical protein
MKRHTGEPPENLITADDIHRPKPLSTDNIGYQGFSLCHPPARELPISGSLSQCCISWKVGAAGPESQRSEAQAVVRDSQSQAGICCELVSESAIPARAGHANDGLWQVSLLGRARALV